MADANDSLSESGGEDGVYGSDSDGPSTLALRRMEASDDEEDDMSHLRLRSHIRGRSGRHLTQDATASVDGRTSMLPYSDDDDDVGEMAGDGEGAPPLYGEDDEEELREEDGHDCDSPSRQLLARRRKESYEEEDDEDARVNDGDEQSPHGEKRGESPGTRNESPNAGSTDVTEEEKKESEPFVVPTAGAFYMHDDRFRDNGGARPRRNMAGRKLWEAKDDKPWVHDLFNELNLGHDKFSGEKVGRGKVRIRGRGRGRVGWGRARNHEDSFGLSSRASSRGQGPRREITEISRDEAPVTANYAGDIPKVIGAPALIDQEHSDEHYDKTLSKKPFGFSYLSPASPPFVPSGALQQTLGNRVEGAGEIGTTPLSMKNKSKELYGTGVRMSMRVAQEETVMKSANGPGKGLVSDFQDSGLVWSESDGTLLRTTPQEFRKQRSSSVSQQQKPGSKAQSFQRFNRPAGGTPAQKSRTESTYRNLASSVVQRKVQAQPQRLPEGQVPSNPHLALHTSPGVVGNNLGLAPNSLGHRSNGGGRVSQLGSIPVSGRGTYTFTGAPPNTALGVGDPSFQSAPAVGPLAVQYAGQSPAGIGVPQVPMSVPSYPYGFPNSGVTWVPVLAGGGAIGAGYVAPYIAMEGAPPPVYYPQAAQGYQLSGREVGARKHQPPAGLWKPPSSSEHGTYELGQCQSKPRRELRY